MYNVAANNKVVCCLLHGVAQTGLLLKKLLDARLERGLPSGSLDIRRRELRTKGLPY